MAINFPSSPAGNQVHTENNLSWKFNGTAWIALPPANNYLTSIPDNSVDSSKIQDNSIFWNDLGQGLRNSLGKADSALQSGDNVTELVNNAGYLTGIPDNSIDTSKIANGSIAKEDLGTGVKDSLDLADSSVQSVTAGSNVTIDNSDPANPVVSSSAGGGTVQGTSAVRDIRAVNTGSYISNNARGENSIDLQLERNNVDQIASGVNSVILGGKNNKATGTGAAVVGGVFGSAEGNYSFVTGSSNTCASARGFVGGGIGNNITSTGVNNSVVGGANNDITGIQTNGAILGGQDNTLSGINAVVLGGLGNTVTSQDSIVAGEKATATHAGARVFADSSNVPIASMAVDEFAVQGSALRLDDGNQGAGKVLTSDANGSGNWATLPTGNGSGGGTVQGTTREIRATDEGAFAGDARGNASVDLQMERNASDQVASGLYSAIIAGRRNKASGVDSVVAGGINNSATANDAFVTGNGNTNSSPRGAVVGGISNGITGTGSNHAVMGGTQNEISATNSHSAILAGNNNTVTSGNSAALAGQRNTLSGTNAVSLGATDGTASATSTLVAGGDATASHEGARVFGDSSSNTIASIATNEFAVQGSALRLVDGNEGAGKVLTCDANGSGNWAQGNGTVQGTDATYDIQPANRVESGAAPNPRGEGSIDLQLQTAAFSAATDVASGDGSVLLGGLSNTASGLRSACITGTGHISSGNNAVTSGGYTNSATGGQSGVYSGNTNVASGESAVVIGGKSNVADGSYTLCAGRLADANGLAGARVIGDSTTTGITARQANEFAIQASALRLEDGNQAVGKVLTCNHTDGSSNWSAPAKVVYTVATLPASPAQGDVAMVTDSVNRVFGSTVSGAGSMVSPVFYDGTDWRIG
jgi:hypothetical protein